MVAGVVWLQQGALADVQKTLAERQAERDKGRSIAKRKDEMLASLEADQQALQYLEDGLSGAAYIPTLLQQIESLARTTGNRVKSVRPTIVEKAPTRLQQRRDVDAATKAAEQTGTAEKKKPQDPYDKFPATVSITGGYTSIQAFVERLQRFPKIIGVDGLQIRPATGAAPGSGKLDAEIKITAFVMKEGKPAGKSGTAEGAKS